MSTATSPVGLPPAIRRSLASLHAGRSIAGGSPPMVEMTERIEKVVSVFRRLRIRWTLVGAHAVGLYTEPRATVDFDFVVDEADLNRALAALAEEFGDLGVFDMGPALRLGALDVDLIRSTTHPLFAEALDRTEQVDSWNVAPPEVLLVLKFLSAVSPWRGRTKQMYDAADLRALYLAVGPDRLDRTLVLELATLVYPGAEAELKDLLGRIERGETISI